MGRRGSGVMLHITSLPSPYGIGDLGPWAYRFADFLAETRQRYWQILPLNPTSCAYGSSSYHSYSAFAGNPLLISPELLLREGMLTQEDLDEVPSFRNKRVDYPAVTEHKARLLDKAYQRYQGRLTLDHEFERFCGENTEWLEDYALFLALKAHFNGVIWRDWPGELRDRREEAIGEWKMKLREQIVREQFFQYLFFKQWSALRQYCDGKNTLIIGDLPIYVSYDSADVWANPKIFKLDGEKRPTAVAGVPPDYFSSTGQLWGNPVYRWDVLRATRYAWWLRRIQQNANCFRCLRLDHFRGFVSYWEVPASEATAMNGRWIRAPAEDFFATLVEQFPGLSILAEDLGLITPDVDEVVRYFGFPGMKVLLFAFGDDLATHPYKPHNYNENCVAYTGTHDTNTVQGWFRSEAGPEGRKRLFRYIGREVPQKEVHWEMIRLAFMSVADTAIIPMQDLLGLGEEARMNRPSTAEGNWEWRFLPEQITPSLVTRLAEMTALYGRASA
ncbi:MAG: 4-alpha-glucanotransferase [Candidatus Binatia bacterium]